MFMGKGLHYPSHAHALLSTPYIQLPPLLFEVERGGRNKTNEGRTHGLDGAMVVPFIYIDIEEITGTVHNTL